MFTLSILTTANFTPHLYVWLFIDSDICKHSEKVCSQKHVADDKYLLTSKRFPYVSFC